MKSHLQTDLLEEVLKRKVGGGIEVGAMQRCRLEDLQD